MFTLFHHPAPADPASPHDRRRSADCITGLLRDLDRPAPRWQPRGARSLYRPEIVSVCAPALRQVRDTLLDSAVDVAAGDLRRLQTFLCEGATSPLFGSRPDVARRVAVELQRAFAAAGERVPTAA